MKTQGTVSFTFVALIVGFFLGVCADSTTRTAFAHGIINAFGIEYDNQASGLAAADVQAAIDENTGTYTALDARIATLESSPCDPNGDDVIVAQEVFDLFHSNGFTNLSLVSAQNIINNTESATSGNNDVLDTVEEIHYFSGQYLIPNGITPCPNQ